MLDRTKGVGPATDASFFEPLCQDDVFVAHVTPSLAALTAPVFLAVDRCGFGIVTGWASSVEAADVGARHHGMVHDGL